MTTEEEAKFKILMDLHDRSMSDDPSIASEARISKVLLPTMMKLLEEEANRSGAGTACLSMLQSQCSCLMSVFKIMEDNEMAIEGYSIKEMALELLAFMKKDIERTLTDEAA